MTYLTTGNLKKDMEDRIEHRISALETDLSTLFNNNRYFNNEITKIKNRLGMQAGMKASNKKITANKTNSKTGGSRPSKKSNK